jgi:hypothetical protein
MRRHQPLARGVPKFRASVSRSAEEKSFFVSIYKRLPAAVHATFFSQMFCPLATGTLSKSYRGTIERYAFLHYVEALSDDQIPRKVAIPTVSDQRRAFLGSLEFYRAIGHEQHCFPTKKWFDHIFDGAMDSDQPREMHTLVYVSSVLLHTLLGHYSDQQAESYVFERVLRRIAKVDGGKTATPSIVWSAIAATLGAHRWGKLSPNRHCERHMNDKWRDACLRVLTDLLSEHTYAAYGAKARRTTRRAIRCRAPLRRRLFRSA